jgi:hypothetical protein
MTEIKGPFGTLRIEIDEVDVSTALGTDAFKTQSVAGLTEYRLNGKTIGPMDAASIAVGEVERLRGLLAEIGEGLTDQQLAVRWQLVRAENARLRGALRSVVNHLGPHGAPPNCENRCEGCRAEMHEACRIADEALRA